MERYWVGKKYGDWNDVRNWADVPNGEPGATAPIAGDDAFFDKCANIENVPYDYAFWPTFHVKGFWIAVELRCFTPSESATYRHSFYLSEHETDVKPEIWVGFVQEKAKTVVDPLCRLTIAVGASGKHAVRNDDSTAKYCEAITEVDAKADFCGDWIEYLPVAVLSVRSAGGLRVQAKIAGTIGAFADLYWGDGIVDYLSLGVRSTPEEFDLFHEKDWKLWPTSHPNILIHEYSEPGEKKISLVVENAQGESDYKAVFFNVKDPNGPTPPIAKLTASAWWGFAPLIVTADISGSSGAVVLLDWGDGSVDDPQPLTDERRYIPHEYIHEGDYMLTLRVKNETGEYDESLWPVHVADKKSLVSGLAKPEAITIKDVEMFG